MTLKVPLPLLQPGTSIKQSVLRDTINELVERSEEGLVAGPGIDIHDNVISAWDQPGGGAQETQETAEWFAKITSSSRVGVDPAWNQWVYGVREAVLGSNQYGGWAQLADGRFANALNTEEEGNTASGLQKSGVNTDNLTGTFAHKPIPVGALVRVFSLTTTNGEPSYWFSRSNGMMELVYNARKS